MTHYGMVDNEIRHGERLASGDPEREWGWKTPAGAERVNRRAGLIIGAAKLGPGRSALEVGCGTGLFTEKFVHSGVSLVAIDVSRHLLEYARLRDYRGKSVSFVEGDIGTINFNMKFDAIIGSSVLHHLDLGRSLNNMLSLLKPGGRLCFAEPNMLNPQIFIERSCRFLPLFSAVSRDETAFVRWRLASALRSAGFEHVAISPHDWLHPAVPEPCIPMVGRVGGVLERTPLIREFAGSHLITCRRPL